MIPSYYDNMSLNRQAKFQHQRGYYSPATHKIRGGKPGPLELEVIKDDGYHLFFPNEGDVEGQHVSGPVVSIPDDPQRSLWGRRNG